MRLAETMTAGAFNGIGTPLPFGFADLLGAIDDAVGPDGTALTWVDGHWLANEGVTGQHLPLWNEGEDEWMLAASNARALESGLAPRPLGDTVRDTLEWIRENGVEPPEGWGLPREREDELLAAWHRRDA